MGIPRLSRVPEKSGRFAEISRRLFLKISDAISLSATILKRGRILQKEAGIC